MDPTDLSEGRVAEMISRVATYLRQERGLYSRASEPLTLGLRTAVQPYFSKTLLESVRAVILKGARIPPRYLSGNQQNSLSNLVELRFSAGSFPDFLHLASVTYLDIIVFRDEIAVRTLFHGLVHATQMALLGVDRYTELYVRGFVKSRSWIAIPLEAQAYQLDTRFAMSPTASFSVEDEVSSWAQQGRY